MVAGNAAAANLESFAYAAMNAFYQAAITFVGQNYGAGQCKRVDKVAIQCAVFVTVTGLTLGNLIYFFGTPLAGIYAPGEPDVVRMAVVRLGYVCCPYFICGVMEVMVGVLRGLSYSVVPMIVSLIGACGLRLVWAVTIFPIYHTPEVLYLSYPVTWAITTAVHALFFFSIRKTAYARVDGSGYLKKMEGRHPKLEEIKQ